MFRTVIWVVAVLVFGLVLAGGGAVYQQFAERRDRSRYPAPGRMVDVGGYRMHVRCLGEGSPAVILESGMGMSSNAWALGAAHCCPIHPGLLL
jgi:hypothetical protein